LPVPRCSSAYRNGEVIFDEDKTEPPNRAYLKLWEFFTVSGAVMQPGALCLDLGASPGGWSWVLSRLGARVISIDKAPLAPHIAAMPRIDFTLSGSRPDPSRSPRDQHGLDAAAQRRQQLLLQAADRQHAAAQRDLAGHGDVLADRNAGQHRDDAVTIATPADGPSLGVAPSGTWTWMSRLSNSGGLMPKLSRASGHRISPPRSTPSSRRAGCR
jgi:hypothetical protein